MVTPITSQALPVVMPGTQPEATPKTTSAGRIARQWVISLSQKKVR